LCSGRTRLTGYLSYEACWHGSFTRDNRSGRAAASEQLE
jgi:hypothetical protein